MKLLTSAYFFHIFLVRSCILVFLLASEVEAQGGASRSVIERFEAQASTQGEGQNNTNQGFYLAPLSDPREAKATKSQPGEEEAEVSITMLWLKLFLALGAFAGLAFLLVRWLQRKRRVLFPETELLEIVAQFSLGINRSLQIVRVVGEYYLLGVTNEQITSLAKLSDQETVDELRLHKKPAPQSRGFFQELVTSYFSSRAQREGGAKETGKSWNDRRAGSGRELSKQAAAPLSSLLVTQFLKQRLKKVKPN